MAAARLAPAPDGCERTFVNAGRARVGGQRRGADDPRGAAGYSLSQMSPTSSNVTSAP